jgi:hypothetical protein
LSEHLKLPIQRINDYHVLLKDLIFISKELEENTDELERAFDLILSIPTKAANDAFLSNLVGFKGNVHKLGRLIAHSNWIVVDQEQKKKNRYIFLFKTRLLITKLKQLSDERCTFNVKDNFKKTLEQDYVYLRLKLKQHTLQKN